MLFKISAAALLAASPAFADGSLRHQSRSLTVCPPAEDVKLTCTVFDDNQNEIFTLGPGDKMGMLDDVDGCYNILCTMAEKGKGGADAVKVLDNKNEHYMWNQPRYWAGRKDGKGCKTVDADCEDAFIKIIAFNNLESDRECDTKEISFKCNATPPTPVPPPVMPPTPCPDDYPHVKKCELKDHEVEIEFDTKGTRMPAGLGMKFTSFERDESFTYEADDCKYDKPEKKEYKKCFLKTKDMEWDDKKFDEKEFKLEFTDGGNCVSRPIECKNKNLTPLGLDLDQSGEIETIRGEFQIDLDGDHFPETLDTWFAPTEGILIDTSYGLENGVNGDHLFGDMGGVFKNGFAKLAMLDADADGVISGAELLTLAVWNDANSNAVLDDDELGSLESYGIVSINVNASHLVSAAMLKDGTSMKVEDIYFTEVQREAIV